MRARAAEGKSERESIMNEAPEDVRSSKSQPLRQRARARPRVRARHVATKEPCAARHHHAHAHAQIFLPLLFLILDVLDSRSQRTLSDVYFLHSLSCLSTCF